MLFLIGKMIFWLIVAAGLGVVLGWSLRQMFGHEKTPDTEKVYPVSNDQNLVALKNENERLQQQLKECLEISKYFGQPVDRHGKKIS